MNSCAVAMLEEFNYLFLYGSATRTGHINDLQNIFVSGCILNEERAQVELKQINSGLPAKVRGGPVMSFLGEGASRRGLPVPMKEVLLEPLFAKSKRNVQLRTFGAKTL